MVDASTGTAWTEILTAVGTPLTILVAVAALWISQREGLDSRRIDQRQVKLIEQGQITDRFTKAVDQLGSGKPDIEIGGAYALERIMRDSAADRPAVIYVLNTYLRSRTRVAAKSNPATGPIPEVQTVLDILGRRPNPSVGPYLDLSAAKLAGANLANADLSFANLARADLNGADLTGALLVGANMQRALLRNARMGPTDLARVGQTNPKGQILNPVDLTSANLNHADLTNAHLTRATLTDANLAAANLTQASLPDANLTRANLILANLTNANLSGTNLTNANLTDVDVTRVNLSGAILTGATRPQ